MRTRTIVALVLALVAVTARHASLAPKPLPKAELIQDVNKLGENAFCMIRSGDAAAADPLVQDAQRRLAVPGAR